MLEDKLTYLGLCEGISTATVAWKDLIKPVGFAEIDEFPSAVLKHHYPDVINFGDITKYKEWKLETDPDLIIGGTPCQSFSVAGLRGGLQDSRGNLTLTFVNILNRFRPKWFIWENVPGVFSSNKGRDFHSFTEGLQAIGYSIGWRVLDAQYFGLAQRRKRVFVVGNNTGDIRGITEVLFEREGLLRDLAQSRQKGKDATKKVGERSTEHDQRKKGVSAFDMQRISEYGNGEKSSTLKRRDYKDHTDLVVDTESAFSAHMSEPMVHKDKSGTLQAKNPTAVVYEAHDTPLVYQSNQTDARIKDMGDTCQTVIARWGTGGNHQPLVQQSVIRRLTPVECERLQGFPDNYTQIPWKGKAKEDCPDSHRYKALGNAMAVPVIQFLGKNIVDYERKRNEER
jgi:DNA (cytosine-5)-methyltransferase 1